MSLNGLRSFRNKAFQESLVNRLQREAAWAPIRQSWMEVFDEEFWDVLGMRRGSFRLAFEKLVQIGEEVRSGEERNTRVGARSEAMKHCECPVTPF